MALINCPECGKENVSDSAIACPNCGYNIKAHTDNVNAEIAKQQKDEANRKAEEEREKKIQNFSNRIKSIKKWKIVVALLCVVLVIVGIVFVVKKAEKRTFPSESGMVNAVCGKYTDGYEDFYSELQITESCIMFKECSKENHKKYDKWVDTRRIQEWDYKNGKIICQGGSEIIFKSNGEVKFGAFTLAVASGSQIMMDFEITNIEWLDKDDSTVCKVYYKSNTDNVSGKTTFKDSDYNTILELNHIFNNTKKSGVSDYSFTVSSNDVFGAQFRVENEKEAFHDVYFK